MSKIGFLVKRWITYIFSGRKKDYSVWVFGEWFGERCFDNSMYLANYVAENTDYVIYWVSKPNADISRLNNKIQIVEKDSDEAKKILRVAGVIIISQGFSDLESAGLNYYRNSITVNLWHGVMWKKIGHDGDKRQGVLFKAYCKVVDPVQRAQCYLITSDNYGKNLVTAFGANPTNFIKAGYPRNSIFYNKECIKSIKARVVSYIRKTYNIEISESTKFVVYMPTFRDGSKETYSFESSRIPALNDYLELNDLYIIQKAHFVNQAREYYNRDNGHIINLESFSAQELMCLADALITDYSGCFFDYLILDKAIIHFLYDYDYYAKENRGLYYSVEDVAAGRVVYDELSLFDAIVESIEEPQKFSYVRKRILDRYMTYESPNACKEILNSIEKTISVKK